MKTRSPGCTASARPAGSPYSAATTSAPGDLRRARRVASHEPHRHPELRELLRDEPADVAAGSGDDNHQAGGVPYVWKLSTVFTRHAWPSFRSSSDHTTVGRSGS